MRLAVPISVALVACTPSVQSSDVSAIDDRGTPVSVLAVPLEPVGGSMVLLISIENFGGVASAPLSLAMAGDVGADFTIVGGCAGVALDRGMLCQVELEFKAAHVGKLTADLVIDAGTDMTQLELDTDVFMPQ